MSDVIRLTLPARPSFADVAAETAATAALRMGFGGAEVDRLRRDVTDAFRASTRDSGGAGDAASPSDAAASVLVELVVDAGEVTVHIEGDAGQDVHLRRRQDAATLDG